MQKIQLKGSELMIKKIAWNTFKNTGDVNTFLEMKQLQEIQSQMHLGVHNDIMQNMQQQMEAQNGNNQNEWYNNF